MGLRWPGPLVLPSRPDDYDPNNESADLDCQDRQGAHFVIVISSRPAMVGRAGLVRWRLRGADT